MKILDIEIESQMVRDAKEYREALKNAEGAEAENYVRQLQRVEPYYMELRRRCQTDPLFLGHLLGDYTGLIERVHGPMFATQVKPDPDRGVKEWSTVKEYLDLDPRGTYKSTCSIVGSVQCILCWADIRICKLTATKPLAKAIANEIGGHFELEPHTEPKLFHLLFPEYCVRPQDRPDGSYTAPCRGRAWREATVMAFSIETSISGWHFDIVDPDDVVDTQNSSTPAGIKKVKKNYRINKKTLMPWGYVNFKGTRYDPFDLGGDMIEKAKPGKTKVLVRGAIKVKSGERLQAGMEFPAENEVELLFPELLSYEFLKKEYDDDPESFITQYMNDAHGGKEVTFTKEALLQVTLPAEMLPITGRTHVAWRFACQNKENMRYAAYAVGIEDAGRVYVLDAGRGLFSPSSLAHRVVQVAKKHGEHNVHIEEMPGARHLEPAIRNYGLVAQWPIAVHWTEFQDDDGARDLRIKGAEPLIATKRLWFSDGITQLAELYRQFCNYGMVEDFEIPDVVARLTGMLPLSIQSPEMEREQDLAWELAKQREWHDLHAGIVTAMAPAVAADPAPEVAPAFEPTQNSYGLDESLGGLNG
jgi:hypothetical protein